MSSNGSPASYLDKIEKHLVEYTQKDSTEALLKRIVLLLEEMNRKLDKGRYK
jgi:predicted transcriptional regulator of viral defense system